MQLKSVYLKLEPRAARQQRFWEDQRLSFLFPKSQKLIFTLHCNVLQLDIHLVHNFQSIDQAWVRHILYFCPLK